MQKGVITLILIALGLCILLASCVKTIEKIFTPYEACKDLKKFDDPDEMRDKYDSCLMIQDEELKTDSVCKKKCVAYCTDHEYTFDTMWIDFSGCHCYCKITYKR
jgi:hypothetical protein